MSDWKETDFGKIPIYWEIKKVIDIKSNDKRAIAMGPFGSNIKAENFIEKGVPVIRGTNLNFDRYVGGDFVYLTEEKADELIGSNCKAGDIVFTHRGTIGQVAMIPNEKFKRYVISQSGMKLTVNPEMMNNIFLFYFFKSEYGQYQILKYEAQVGVPSISNPLTSLKEMQVPVPPFPEQTAIAEVLSSLDDKIDLLHRQNKTLEQLAETLFRQWFVEEADESWKIGNVEDLFKLQRGFDLPIQNRIEGQFPIITSSGINGSHNEFKVNGPGVTTGRSGLLGKVFYIDEDFWPLNTSLFIVNYKIATPLFSYFFLKTMDIASLNGGSAVPTLNRNDVHSIETLLPPKSIVLEFENYAKDYFQKIKSNATQIRTLTKLRDTLLPKLMSGEVRVSEL